MGYVSRRRDGAAFVFLCEVSLPDFEGTVQKEVKRGEGEGEGGTSLPFPPHYCVVMETKDRDVV